MKLEQLKEKVKNGLRFHVDSREVRAGDAFVVTYENVKFVGHAINCGARYIVIPPEFKDVVKDFSGDIIFVENSKKIVGDLAALYYGTYKQNFLLIGITGTNGKTTTSYLIEHLLKNLGMNVGVIGTINYRWNNNIIKSKLTTPGCIELHSIISDMIKDKTDAIIMEVSSHGLDQDRVAGLKFDYAVFTNLSQDHLDYHKNMDEYFRAKLKLFDEYLRDKQTAILNLQDPYGIKIKESIQKKYIGYGFKSNGLTRDGNIIGELVKSTQDGQKIRCFYKDKEWEIDFPLLGSYNVLNLLAAQGVGIAMGIRPQVFKCFEHVSQIPGRLEKVTNPYGLNIFIDYAHTPDALENVLKTIRSMGFEKVITVFGCGGDRDKKKRPLMGKVAEMYSDIVVVTSDNPRGEDPELIINDIISGLDNCGKLIKEMDRKKAIEIALSLLSQEDVLLIAGKGHEDYQEIEGVRYPFSDRAVVEEILGTWK